MAADGLWVPRHSHGTPLQHAMRLQMAGVEGGGWRVQWEVRGGRLLAQKGLGRLLHRGGTRCRCAHGQRTMQLRLQM